MLKILLLSFILTSCIVKPVGDLKGLCHDLQKVVLSDRERRNCPIHCNKMKKIIDNDDAIMAWCEYEG